MVNKKLLKFITCGSVDDGKSTLIGHMLYSAKLIFADQERSLELDSKVGAANGKIDYSLLLDGLEAEREQGITIDVAYRFFSTERRSFIVADTPGHEEYTRNMAVGASFADLAVILVDASKGILIQTKRHARICALMGIKDYIFAINKMDLIQYDEKIFRSIEAQIQELVSDYDFHSLLVIPVSAVTGDNLTEKSQNTWWYHGQPLLDYLEGIETEKDKKANGFCMAVQRVCRPNQSFRGFQGEVLSGEICIGDEVECFPSGEKAKISKILLTDNYVERAITGNPVTICLDREIDVSRGCVLAKDKALKITNSFAGTILWMDYNKLEKGKNYRLQIGTNDVVMSVKRIVSKTDINTGKLLPADTIAKNELALCEIEVALPIAFDLFENTAALGNFIITDRISNATVACGIVNYALNEDGIAVHQELSINRSMREKMNGHRAMTIWFTGLSGAGKSTIADYAEKTMFGLGVHTMVLDGDNVRMGLCKDLGFSDSDRKENIRRVAETAKLLNDAGVVVFAAYISPFESDRQMARTIIGDSFVEVYVEAPIDTCIRRDVKGLYKKAIRGEIREFTGISSPYEVPKQPDILLNTELSSVEDCCDMLLKKIKEKFR